MGVSTQRAGVVAVALVYVLLLEVFYAAHIHPQWQYMGFGLNEVPIWLNVFCIAVAVMPTTWMPLELVRPSAIGYWMLFVFAYVPSIIVPPVAFGGGSQWVELDVVLLGCTGILALVYRAPLFSFRRPDEPRTRARFWLTFTMVTVTLYIALVYAFGVKLEIPKLADLYSVRADYKLQVKSVGSWASYVLGWTGNVVNPFLMVIGFATNRRSMLVAGALGQVFLFTITALKSILLSTVLIATLFAALRRRGRHLGMYMIGGVTTMLVTGGIEKLLLGSTYVGDILVRRMIYIPGLLTGMYVEFFSSHPKAMLGHSVLRGVVRYPYDTGPARLVGGAYFEQANSNASVWADGFANFGLPGVVAATLILGVTFWLFDCASKGLDRASAAAMFGMPGLSISNSGILTALFTHGIGLVTLLAAAAPKPDLRRRPAPPRRRPRAPPARQGRRRP